MPRPPRQDHEDDAKSNWKIAPTITQEERDQAGPEDPLPHVEVQLVAVEGARPEHVQHDEHDEQDARRDPDRVEHVGEVDLCRTPIEEVIPGQQLSTSHLGYRAGNERGVCHGPWLYSARNPRTERPRSVGSVCGGPDRRHSRPARWWSRPRTEGLRLRALLSVATRDGITTFARGLQSLDVELFATDGTREHLAQDGVEVKPVTELTGVADDARRPGQDLPPRDLRRHPRAPRPARPARGAASARASSRSTSSSSTSSRSAPRSGGRSSGSIGRSR